ncbi:MAG: right-handed parallel beta-helix repeat-containing protein [Solirubrobacterales bacterium]
MSSTLALFAVLAVTAATADAKQADPVCGQVVRDDLVLKNDLDCSTSGTPGLVVGKDGITIDLNGHVISGAGAYDLNEGIENAGHDNVTIKNGEIRRFSHQIYFLNVARSTVTGVRFSGAPGAANGIYSSYGTGNHFVGNYFFLPNYGIELSNGSENLIRDNVIKEANRGVTTSNEAFDQIIDNVSKGFSISTYAFYSLSDYRMKYDGDIANGGYQGFYALNPRGLLIRRSQANENGYAGIYIDANTACPSCSARIRESETSKNAEYGIYAVFPVSSLGNTALGNGYYNCHLVACNGRRED